MQKSPLAEILSDHLNLKQPHEYLMQKRSSNTEKHKEKHPAHLYEYRLHVFECMSNVLYYLCPNLWIFYRVLRQT